MKMLSTLQTPRSLSRLSSFSTHASLAHLSPPLTTTPNSPPNSQILSLRHSLLSRHLSAADLIRSHLDRLHHSEPLLRSFLHLSDHDSLLAQARLLDDRIHPGEELGPLAGVLVAVKDNICTADMPSTGGSRILKGYRPPFDATAVKRLKELGAIVVGKTNLDEFGMGSTTEGSAFQS